MIENEIKKIFFRQQFEKPSDGLFDKIIFEIGKKEINRQRRLVLGILFLLIISFFTMPFSWMIFMNQVKDSGISYFISTALSDIGLFFSFWQDFTLVILDLLPTGGLVAILFSLAIFLFALRQLFLYKKKFSFGCLAHK